MIRTLFNQGRNYGLERVKKDAFERHLVANHNQNHGERKKVTGRWDEGHDRLDLGFRLTAFQSERAMMEIKVSYIEIVLVKWEGGKRKIWVRQTERKTFPNQQRNLEKPAAFGPHVKHHQQLSYRQALLSWLSFWTRRSLRKKKSDFNIFAKCHRSFLPPSPSVSGSVALLLSIVYRNLTSYDMCWCFLRVCIYSIILRVEVAYRLASDTPLSWVT